MSKKMLKRSLALGALMAFVITGSAWAADVTDNYEAGTVLQGEGQTINGYGTITGAGDLTIKSTGNNAVTINEEGKKLTITANQGSITLDADNNNGNTILAYDDLEITAKDTLNMYAGNRVIRALDGAEVNLTADKIYMNQNEAGDGSYTLVDDAAIKVTDGAKLNVTATNGLYLNAVGDSTIYSVLAKGNNTKVILNGGNQTNITGGVFALGREDIGVDNKQTDVVEVKVLGNNIAIDANGGTAVKAQGDTSSLNANGENQSGAGTDTTKVTIGSKDTQKIEINNAKYGLYSQYKGSSVEVNGTELVIDADSAGIFAGNSRNDTDIETNPYSVVNVNSTSTKITSEDTGLWALSHGTININGDLEIEAGYAVITRGTSTVNINQSGDNEVKIIGDIVFDNTSGADINDPWTGVNSNVNINLTKETSYLKGDIYAFNGERKSDETKNAVSGMMLTLSNGATWTTVTGESFVNTLNMNEGILEVANGTKVQVGVNSNDAGWFGNGTVVLENASDDSQVTLSKKEGTVTVASNIDGIDNMTDEQITDALSEMQGAVVMDDDSEAADYAAHYGESALYDEVKIAMEDLQGENAASALDKTIASTNVDISDMAALGMMSWRAEMNDMNKRMGELRNANGEHGVWVRMVRGEDEYNNVKTQYNQYQLGYDEKLSVDKRWTVGMALSYTDGETSFAKGSGENTNKALSIYGSKLNNDGTFVDLIAKYARLENDFKAYDGIEDADYSTNGYSVSAEFGKRIEQGKGLWIEPQVELNYGKVSAVDYLSKAGVKVAQDSMESLVGRVGFSLGKDIKQGNVYARASYLYDFDGETSVTLNGKETLEQDLGGGWWEVGVGANINLSKATYIYADVEKTFGGEVDTNWQWNLGVRYSF